MNSYNYIFFLVIGQSSLSTLFPYTTLFRSAEVFKPCSRTNVLTPPPPRHGRTARPPRYPHSPVAPPSRSCGGRTHPTDRKSTRLNSSHVEISYAVFCLKKKSIDLFSKRYIL